MKCICLSLWMLIYNHYHFHLPESFKVFVTAMLPSVSSLAFDHLAVLWYHQTELTSVLLILAMKCYTDILTHSLDSKLLHRQNYLNKDLHIVKCYSWSSFFCRLHQSTHFFSPRQVSFYIQVVLTFFFTLSFFLLCPASRWQAEINRTKRRRHARTATHSPLWIKQSLPTHSFVYSANWCVFFPWLLFNFN